MNRRTAFSGLFLHLDLFMIQTEIARCCVECGQRIAGRTDKKFCNDQCRTSWHNKHQAIDSRYVRTVNCILRRNRRILAELAANGSKEIRSIALKRRGFDFSHFTSARKVRGGQIEHFCYDLGYVPVNNGVYLLKTRHRQ